MTSPLPIPTADIDRFAAAVAAAIPVVAERIPATPAAVLGRLTVTANGDAASSGAPVAVPGMRTVVRSASPGMVRGGAQSGRPRESEVRAALRSLGPLLAERLLGALELSVDAIAVELPAGATDTVATPARASAAFVTGALESETSQAVARLDAVRPGASELAVELARRLVRHDALAAVLVADLTGLDEATIAARHGSVYLGLSMVVASAVSRALGLPMIQSAPTVVGMALGVAAAVLRGIPMPAGYADAVLAKKRAEYRYPQSSSTAVEVHGHRFALAETPVADEGLDFADNGVAVAVDGGVVLRTGMAEGQASVLLQVLAEPPDEVDLVGWDEVVEISWTAATGAATLPAARHAGSLRRLAETPPWPGAYRLRVHTRGRDGDDDEGYRLMVWSAPDAPQTVYKRTDRLGYELRGEPAPPAVAAAEQAYRWVESSWVATAATITVVTGSSVEEVLRAFGADPAVSVSLQDTWPRDGLESMVCVLPIDGAVLAVEDNGWHAIDVMDALSRNGTAASMYWNVNAVTRLSFARAGEVVASFEVGDDPGPAGPELTAALDGLDFADPRHWVAKGVTAVARFAGRDFDAAQLERIRQDDIAYPITSPETGGRG